MRKRERECNRIFQVWSCGGGVDSAAMAVLICQGRLPKPDYAIMTDNGYDSSYTWDYVDQVLKPKLAEIGVDLVIIKSKEYVDTNIVKGGTVVIPAYSKKDGKAVRFGTKCSGTWKLTPAKRWLRERGVERCINWIGIAADEPNRIRQSRLKWISFKYPLYEYNLSRRDCKRLIKEAGWPVPLRSSCVMCPQRTDNQWLDLRDDYPGDYQRAVDIEMGMHETNPDVFLHRSLKRLDHADFRGGG